MKRLLSALILLALAGGVAWAGVPDAYNSTVSPADLMTHSPRITGILNGPSPSPFADLTVTVRNFANVPINGAYVEVVINSECEDSICMCDGTDLTGYTGATGAVTINLGFGGCCNIGAAAAVYADGVVLRAFDWIVSPDYNGELGNCIMGLDDFTVFGNYWVTGGPGCTDYNGNDATEVVDFTIFGQAWLQGCTPAD